MSRTSLAVGALLAIALGCWIVALHGMSAMGGLGPFVGAWVTTMAAMMLPAAAPMVIAYTWLGRPRASTPAFVLGYLVTWTVYGLAAYAIAQAVPDWSARRLAAFGLVLAGAYQLTPLKRACLRACRAPLGFVALKWRSGRVGALTMGIEHGLWCAGCCTGLMLALFALGMDSLGWMAAVALLILAEKIHPLGARLAPVTGAAFLVAGVVVLA